MLRLGQWVAVTALAFTATGCATAMTVSSHVQPGADFARYRTYDWGPADALPTSDPRLNKDVNVQDYLQGAIARQLELKGLERASSGNPDLLIHYHTNVADRFTVEGTSNREDCRTDDCGGEKVAYEAGTIVLDILDARSHALVWRGWAQDSLRGVIGDQDAMEAKIDEAVPRMVNRLPVPLHR